MTRYVTVFHALLNIALFHLSFNIETLLFILEARFRLKIFLWPWPFHLHPEAIVKTGRMHKELTWKSAEKSKALIFTE